MKTKKYFSIVITILFAFLANAQTVTLYTPSGSSVQAFMQSEMSASDITYYTNAYRTGYPQATVLANASSTYNCHSYAWNISEGGTSICWLNQAPDLHKYWDDFSYEETTEANAEKIFYFNGDHSAIKSTTVADKYESKWGAMPKMRHAPDYGPNVYNMSYRRYYAKFSSLHPISGSSQLCSQGTYTINNLPAGTSVSWSASPSGIVSLQPNGSSVTLTKVGNGKVTLSAMINNSFTVTKDIWVGAPKLMSYTTTPKQLCAGEPFIFNAVIPDGSTITSATGLSEGTEIPLSTINSTSYEVPGDVSRITLSIENSCGNVTVRKLIPKANCLNYYFSITPNPSSNNATISMTSFTNASTSTLLSASASSSVSTSYSVKVLDVYGSIVYTGKKTGKQFTIPTAPLRNGVYSIIVSDGTNTYQDKLIVKH